MLSFSPDLKTNSEFLFHEYTKKGHFVFSFSYTPLHYCAGFGHHSCTKALLYSAEHQSYELDLSAANSKGTEYIIILGK